MLRPPRAYVYLDTVARAGSIRKAAEQLHVASTALNRKIKETEDSLGTPLFERLPRGVRLTAAGEVMVAAVRRSMADVRAAVSHIEHLRGEVRGTVRLGCAESVGTDLIRINCPLPANAPCRAISHGQRRDGKSGDQPAARHG